MTTNAYKIIAVSSLVLASTALSAPAHAQVDPTTLQCDFSTGIPQGMSLVDLQAIATNKATYLSSPNPICNPYLGYGVIMPTPVNACTVITWPIPFVPANTSSTPTTTPVPTPTPTFTPAPTPTATPAGTGQVLAASTAPILPVTGATNDSAFIAAILAVGAGLVAFFRNR